MIETKQFLEILKKYREGNASKEEQEFLRTYYNLFELEPDVLDTMDAQEKGRLKNRMEKHLIQQINGEQPNNIVLFPWKKITAAAAVLLVIGSGLFFYNRYANTPRHLEGSAATRDLLANNIKPGTNKAILTLANGKKLSLTDAANGALAKEQGVEISKTADGQVIYTVRHPGAGRDLARESLNTIETPKGGQYQVHLPDGSKVWLNAASKLTYPVSFHGREDRRVELSGEAYFEIEKDKDHPFKVKTTSQEVEVLGTHFNINSYADEVSTKTTLLEGSVKVIGSINGRHPGLDPGPPPMKILKPNQQSINDGKTIKVSEADPTEAIAWQKGYFQFTHQTLQSMMRQISRWYDVEIEYQGSPDQSATFSGTVSRFDNVEKVLRRMELTGQVKFKIETKKIIVFN